MIMLGKTVMTTFIAALALTVGFSPLPKMGNGGFWVSVFVIAAAIFLIVFIWLLPVDRENLDV